jgi:tetratricopeptide (TPR) repeat protein
MNRKPVVFLGSVFRGVKKRREQLYRIITEDFGWECNAYEFHSEEYVGSPESACLNEVEDCDLYIGIFWKHAGSIISHDNLYITELEYYRARKLRKPMMIYVVEAEPESRDAHLDYFIKTMMEPDNGPCIEFCKNFHELISKIKKGLDFFGDCWGKGEIASWAPSFLIDKILTGLGFLTEHTELYHLPRQALFLSRDTDVTHLRRRLDAMRRYYERAELQRTGEVGSDLLLAFLKAGISFEKKELLPMWAEFLRMWAGTCTWLNLLNMPYDAVWAARMLRETYEAQEQWPAFHDSASLVSHTFYVQSCSKRDEKLLLGIEPTRRKRFQEERQAIFSLQVGLEKERQQLLQKALEYDKLFVARTKPKYLYLYRAYIYQVMGHYDQAISDFERMALYRRETYSSDDIGYIDILADFGGTKVLKAVKDRMSKASKSKLLNEGLHLLEDAHEKAQMYSSSPRQLPYYIIIEKEYAKGLLFSGDKKAAGSLLERVYQMAVKEGLSQQAGSIGILLDKSRGLLR